MWVLAVVAVGGLQVAIGFIGFLTGWDVPTTVPALGSALTIAAFGFAACWLFVGGSSDHRAWSLGVVFLLIASAFARRFVGIADGSWIEVLVRGVFPDAFLAAFLWDFARRFPLLVRFGVIDAIGRIGWMVSLVVGVSLFVANVAQTYGLHDSTLLLRSRRGGLYWGLVLALSMAAVLTSAFRFREARGKERRRVLLFCLSLGATLTPVVLEILIEILAQRLSRTLDGVRGALAPLFFAPLLALPFLTAYAIIVDRILEVRIVLGRALQYVLARATLTALTGIPLLLLFGYGYQNRALALTDLLAGSRAATLLLLMTISITLWATRTRLLTAIDRHFLRPSADLAGELLTLVARLRLARSVGEIVEHVELHLPNVTGASGAQVLLANTACELVSVRGGAPPLPPGSALASLVEVDASPIDLRDTRQSVVRLLPSSERGWVQATDSALLVPLIGAGDRRLGIIAIGSKRSETPFGHDELSFFGAAAAATAMAIDARRPTAALELATADDEPANECSVCGIIVAPDRPVCACHAPLRIAALPATLNRKFHVEQRLGAGGMGVVYRAHDATLGRPVALKTLTTLSGAAADRLGHEARVMASFVHANLATIFGIERWRATPILVVEYLAQGTLAARLAGGPIDVASALDIGKTLAPALERLHASGVLHRDIKPSNIGFSSDGIPKLLDFGLASFVDSTQNGERSAERREQGPDVTQSVVLGFARSLTGTPLYLDPEVLGGGEPSAAADVWALSLVIYEAIAGQHPFSASNVQGVLDKVRVGRLPRIERFRSDCPHGVSAALSSWLSVDPSQRPRSARELLDRLNHPHVLS